MRLAPIPEWTAPLPPAAPAALEGHVLALRADLEPVWVLIDLGSSQGVATGTLFGVFHEGNEVAQLVVDEVSLHQSACRVTFAWTAELVQVGDLVSTRDALGELHPFSKEEWPPVRVPPIDATVLAIKNDVEPRLVLLDVGTDDRVEPGFRFSIYRKAEFIGKVIVERVLRNSAGCRVLFVAEGKTVEPNDAAATRLQ